MKYFEECVNYCIYIIQWEFNNHIFENLCKLLQFEEVCNKNIFRTRCLCKGVSKILLGPDAYVKEVLKISLGPDAYVKEVFKISLGPDACVKED